MAKVGNRQYKTLVCSECKEENYREEKNVRNTTDRLEMNKYCAHCRSTQGWFAPWQGLGDFYYGSN